MTYVSRCAKPVLSCVACAAVSLHSPTIAQAHPVPNVIDTVTRPSVFTVGDEAPTVIYLHEVLAQLGYLPVDFRPLIGIDAYGPGTESSPSVGIWQWRYANMPKEVKELWNPVAYTSITRAAVMVFQHEHGLPVDGFAGPRVFRALQLAMMTNVRCHHPYTCVIIQQAVPQTLEVWQEGRMVFKTPCSTGVEEAPTHTGTYAIYLRNRKQKMEGDTPSGKHYRVEDVPYVSFFYRGEAIHGLKRSVYGIPQSVGCVELPIDAAKHVWELTEYGTLVIVRPPHSPAT
jgi:peptidoglycan hydrolase-like protein with peptidoglycan-binding domain